MTNTATPDLGGWLALAAAPTFAFMAFWSARAGEPICGMAASPLGGMTAMYVLMCAFHLAPWLRWLGRSASRRETSGETT